MRDDTAMIKAWFTRNASSAITVASIVVIAAILAGVAFVSQGYTAQRLDLSDGSVWVANGQEQVIGRANTEIRLLNTVVESSGNEIDVVQQGSTVLLVDRANTRLDIVDPAMSEVVDSVALPTEGPQIFLAGDAAVVYAQETGEVWITSSAELGSFDAATEPLLSLGANAAVTVAPGGYLHAYSADTGQLYRVDLTTDEVALTSGAETRAIDFEAEGEDVAITTVGDRVAIIDYESRSLWMDGTVVDLSDEVDAGDGVRLQEPGPESGTLLLATSEGLLQVGFDGAVGVLVAERSATAAAPIVVGGCSFAGWADGLAWRDCGGSAAVELQLAGADAAAARLEFAVNGDRVVLNEPHSGRTWAVQAGGELIDNWSELIEVEENQEQVEQNDLDSPPEFEKTQVPPVASDDLFGARPGRPTVLPVLLNDYDANGDVLVVSEVGAIDESVGQLDIVRDGQQVQLTLNPTAQGSLSFPYTITDGRGGSASATVTVEVRAPGENGPPEQVRQSRSSVAQGGRVTANILGDWVDPDGDVIYLAGASTADPDSVSYKPEGAVVFQEGGAAATLRTVAVSVTDGTARGAGSLSVTVNPAGEVPIIADPFAVRSYAGGEVRVRPLEHVRGGTGTVRLSAVPSRTGATITPNLESGTFRFTSDQVRTFYVEYVVTDGSQTVTGLVRIDVEAPPDANSTPITVPKTVFVKTLSEQTIDVASIDIDPAGGVLMVTSVSTEQAPGVRAQVLEQRSVRISLEAPLDSGPVTVDYRITNGLAEAAGTITVIEIPPAQLQAPVATDDSVTVRVGDTIDIPVLANDIHPDGEPLTLSPELVERASGSGLLFASGDRLRYLAPEQTGDFTAVYAVMGPDGQTSQAQVRIAVREVVEATNGAPTPSTLTARVTAGGTVSIRVPLTGIDPDGDSVQLLGLDSAPEKGAVTDVGTDTIEYEAGGYSAGTDTFTYTVMDSLGARSTGKVRVGISPPLQEARNPVATADEVVTRPGGSVSVQVLANDIDPDGGTLTITSVVPNTPEISAEIDGEIVVIDVPEEQGQYGLVYEVENGFGGTSSAFITVMVDPEAPLAYPIANDTVLTLSDILERETITVDVLQNVFFADGPTNTLAVRLLERFSENAVVTDDGDVTVTITERRQIIPFSVVHPDDPEVISYAFIRVPGLDDALPQLDRRAKPLTVASESRLVIDINDHVIAVGGKSVRLTDRTTVRASNSNGDPLVVDDDTLVFTSADKYFGPASISFEVTDGATANAAGARTATLVLPIRVTPRENQPPVFAGGTIEFEPAEERSLDLLRLTNYPHPDDIDELAYRVLEPLPRDFSYTLTGSTLTLRADPAAAKGSQTAITLGVRDELSEGQAGTITLRVVASTRPLARPAPDRAVTPRGETTTIDVLANDAAANPFPGQPLSVVAIRGLDGGTLPEGVSVVPSADRSRLTVSVSESAAPTDTQLQYQVADATGDPSRYMWGTVTISVQDVPDTPVAPSRAGGHTNGVLTLRITPPAFNNSPITSFEVVSDSNGGYRKNCGLEQLCSLSDLRVGASYEFRVIATNSLGASEASPASVPLRVDYLPAAPTDVTARASGGAEGELAISWSRVPDPSPGTPVSGYTVRISGPGVGQTDIATTSTSLTTTVGGLVQAGQAYQVIVFARNGAQATTEEWNHSSPVAVTAVGAPPAVPVSARLTGTEGHIAVTWSGAGWNGARAGSYHVARFSGGSAPPATCTPGAYPGRIAADVASGWVDTSAIDGVEYTYVVYSDNRLFCTVSVSGAVESKREPGQAAVDLVIEHSTGGYYDVRVRTLSALRPAARYEVMIGGNGAWRPVARGDFVTSPALSTVYGQPVTVQVRACRDGSADLCGAASAPQQLTPVATRASVLSCIAGEAFTPNPPANVAGFGAPSYRVQFRTPAGIWLGAWQTWTPEMVVPENSTALRIRATVGGYQDPEYGETQCEVPPPATEPGDSQE
ncbi:tandem-95 repeat protein [Salinibacterium sp. dk2585]|uniref:Ig-like domain-containing protein n=1 Tax=unclassified Salinibacterium TaxID=2632331 RepID=UPI0011C25406|nr:MULTISPECIES: Ig-like domain-containing protein [unclassified Salinibacterium]QEE61728.1 tandem-95 repeat protein [Salinibacterium sp. dk2585]TXK54717.1 tandem-95 repeat protein [Salinibacterium sp. dk5596]